MTRRARMDNPSSICSPLSESVGHLRNNSATLIFNMGGLFVDILVEYIFRVVFRAMQLLRSRKWPVVRATVLSADCPQAGFGCTVVTVYYEYVVNGEKHGDTFDKPFVSPDSGEEYAEQIAKGMGFNVRVKPDDATASVPLAGDAALI